MISEFEALFSLVTNKGYAMKSSTMKVTDTCRRAVQITADIRSWDRTLSGRGAAALLVSAMVGGLLAVFCPRMVAAGEDLVDLTTPDNGIITSCSSHTSYSGAKAFDDGSVSDEKSRWLVVKSNDTLTNA